MKWLISFAWNQGVFCFQKEGDREQGKRYFQFSSQILVQAQRLLTEQTRNGGNAGNRQDGVKRAGGLVAWQQLQAYIEAVGPRMEQVQHKVLFEDFS